MLAVLRVDGSGRVVEGSPSAVELLGEVEGRRCCDVVVARHDGRRVVCRPDCPVVHERADNDLRAVEIRGRSCRLVCQPMGAGAVVTVVAGGDSAGRLTAREREVLELVAQGYETDEIAALLGVTGTTVRTHVERSRGKLGARTRAEAVARALRSDEIEGPTDP
ncbi:MAG: helix-turn-helix transcriptional regulator [Myxococcota bacterium]